MSHVAKVDIIIQDLESLEKAAQECGLVFKWNQKTYKWYGRWMNDYNSDDAAYNHGIDPKDYGKCDHAMGVPNNPGAYEVGVVKNPHGDGYVLIWDFFGGGYGLQQHLGGSHDCNKLMDAYCKQVILKQAVEQGFSVGDTETEEDGTIVMTLYDYT